VNSITKGMMNGLSVSMKIWQGAGGNMPLNMKEWEII
jgi:hypothetical protein